MSNQLKEYKESSKKTSTPQHNGNGSLKTHVLTAGPRGPVLLQDAAFIDDMAHFDRERIPERVVHARGSGAFGHFQVTHDITDYTRASVFSSVGTKTPVAARFSTIAGEMGSAETVRDPRGFAVKFYTDDGNWDLVGLNTPVFFLRDPFLFSSFVHSQKRNPVTNIRDANAIWDFITLRPETMHMVMFLFSDRGIPDGYRHMHGFGCHAFKLVNSREEAVYCKFHCKTDQGIKNLTVERAGELASKDPDYATRDLYNAIENKEYPTWTLYIQVMALQQAETSKFNPFDVTKVWPYSEFPLHPVGKIVLNRNPSNYFLDVEQIAFCPGTLVPGIEPSPDKVLQGRMFSYNDTQRHRLGANYMQLPVNCPYRAHSGSYERDGPMAFKNPGQGPNYFPSSFAEPERSLAHVEHKFPVSGEAGRWDDGDDDNFTQPGLFWKLLDGAEQDRLTTNIADHLRHAQEFLRQRAVARFVEVDPEFGKAIEKKLQNRA